MVDDVVRPLRHTDDLVGLIGGVVLRAISGLGVGKGLIDKRTGRRHIHDHVRVGRSEHLTHAVVRNEGLASRCRCADNGATALVNDVEEVTLPLIGLEGHTVPVICTVHRPLQQMPHEAHLELSRGQAEQVEGRLVHNRQRRE